MQEPNGSLQTNAVWPDTDASYGCPAVYSNGMVTWPKIPAITGGIHNGLPASGDFIGKSPTSTPATGENLHLVAAEKSCSQQGEQPVLGATGIKSVDEVKNSHVMVKRSHYYRK